MVVPSRQRAVAVRLAHTRVQLQRGRKAWESCDVLPWAAWLERCAAQARRGALRARRSLGATEEWLLWREAAESACAGLGLLRPETLADPLRRSSGRARDWGMRWAGAPTIESSVLEQARATVATRCQERHAYSRGDWTEVLREFEAGPTPPLFAGFDALGPKLKARLELLGGTFWPDELAAEPSAAPQLVGCADPADELRRAARWCREQLERNPAARLLVIDTRLTLRRALAVQAFEHELHGSELLALPAEPLYGIEGGQSLADYVLVGAALRLLHFSGAPLEFAEIAALLRSPYIGCGTQAERAALELLLRERNVAELDLEDLRALARAQRPGADTTLADALLAFALGARSDGPARDHASGWARRFAARLAAGGWPGPAPLGSEEQQQCERLRELLGEFSTLGGSGALLSFHEALELLRALAAGTAYETATLDAPVTLSASTEDPLIPYDGIWVAGLGADSWPAAPRADAFVPIGAQRAAGYRPASARGQLEAARQAMAAWRRCARELVYSWPEADGEVTLPASQLLEFAGHTPQPEHAAARRAGADRLVTSLRQDARRERRPADLALPWPAGRRLVGGTALLRLQSQCPFKAVAQLRLGAAPVTDPVPGLDRRERGLLLHRALELVFGQIRDSRALRERFADAPALTTLVHGATAQAVAAQVASRTRPLPEALLENERSRLSHRILALLREELIRAESAEFTVASLEDSQDRELPGFSLRVRMDRVDRLDDGRLVILDYKSGAAAPFRALDERPGEPQLLAYALLAEGNVAAVAAVHLGADKVRWRGAAAEPSVLPGLGRAAPVLPWPQLLRQWRGVVEGLVRDFAAGTSSVDPLAGACQYCPLPAFCRIAPGRRNESIAEAAEQNSGQNSGEGANGP